MGVSISGSNAISGLGGNDTNFDEVLSQLKKIEQTQLNRLEAWKSDWSLRYDAFSEIIEQIQAASSMLAQLSDKNNFVTKNVQSANENIVTAIANAAAQDVQHSINVKQVASNSIWANTGHVFNTKNDVINTTGQDQYFSYTYAGERHDFKVPANTTLESFASMLNNSAENPGIRVSLIQTGSGYVFQVAGTETGAKNDLIIHDSNLVGMNARGTTSTWQTNASMKLDENVIDPTEYVFDLVLQGGATKSVVVKGTATADELVTALNGAAGGIKASVDAAGNLTIEGVQSFSRRASSDEQYVPASTRVSLNGVFQKSDGSFAKLNEGGLADGLADDEKLIFTVTMDDGSTRTVEIEAGTNKRDFFAALARATQDDNNINLSLESDGWGVKLAGVKDVTVALADTTDSSKTLDTSAMSAKTEAATGVKESFGGSLTATTTVTFAKDNFDKRVDGKEEGDGDAIVFTLLREDGTADYIEGDDFTSKMSNKEALEKLEAELTSKGYTFRRVTDRDGNETLEIDGVKSFKATAGSISGDGFSTSLKSSMTIPASNPGGETLFYTDPSGNLLLEEAPDLVYTVTTNDGKTGVLTLPSGTPMRDVLAAMTNASSSLWEWTETDASGNTIASTAPADWSVRFTDASGKEYVDANGNPLALDDIDGPVYLNMGNVQTSTGPGVTGQIATSSNWSIQRSANARYVVDNWPMEMESDSNTIGDVIEGVVFTIHEEGQARISVSTDITSVEQSIQNFLDAVNSVILTVNKLMEYDENKQVTSNDPNDIGSSNYSPSGLTSQKGGLLTGNYGVQLFKSRFSSLLGASPPGFKSRSSAEDVLSGDLLASLANLGIKTDTDTTSDTYGLLTIAPSSSIGELQSMDKANYTDMITNHLEAVVDFFCSSGTGASSSTDFRYASHVEGITVAGNYDVKYTVTEDGDIVNVTVGGEPAKRDESKPGYYFTVTSGDPRGVAIQIDDLTVGEHPPAGAEAMQVRIKQGLVQTTNSFLKSELVYNDVSIHTNSTQKQIEDAIALKSKNGALMSLRDNYKKVMESIDVKIEREQRRIDTWESRQKSIFANLETLLKQYSQKQTSLEAQLKQLSSD